MMLMTGLKFEARLSLLDESYYPWLINEAGLYLQDSLYSRKLSIQKDHPVMERWREKDKKTTLHLLHTQQT